MNNLDFEQFVLDNGKDILRFCRMTCGDIDLGDELYQDTMLKLLEKKHILDTKQNIKSYALSTSILLWKNKRKKTLNRNRLIPMESIDTMNDKESIPLVSSPESTILHNEQINIVQELVTNLPEKQRIPIYLFYSADMSINEISKILHIPEGTVKSRMNKAKQLLKKSLEELGYDWRTIR